MKKVLLLILSILLTLGLFGCSEKTSTSDQDANFLKDVKKAAEARWEIVDKSLAEAKSNSTGALDTDKDYEYRKQFVSAESQVLYQYENSEFKDAKLGKLAKDYISGIKSQEKALEYYYGDENQYGTFWKEGYDKRSESLLKLVEDYGVEFSADNLRELKQNAQVVKETKELDGKIEEMARAINFELEKEDYGWKTYTAVVENTTDVEFQQFELNIKLVDSDGVTIESPNSYTQNWKPGEKVRFEFNTDKEFTEIKWDWKYYK